MSDPVDLILEQYHRALDAVVAGDSALMKKLISKRDDVTLANPLGPPVRGWEDVERTMDHAISHFRGGEPTHFERISKFVGTELAYIVELERTRVKICESDQMSSIALRVTTIFHLEDGGWKVLHRHGTQLLHPGRLNRSSNDRRT